jgi:hypothetical protein
MRCLSLALIFCFAATAVARELLQVQLLHRHGDRTPLTELPAQPVDWEATLGVGLGMLTGYGARQAQAVSDFSKFPINEQLIICDSKKMLLKFAARTLAERTVH